MPPWLPTPDCSGCQPQARPVPPMPMVGKRGSWDSSLMESVLERLNGYYSLGCSWVVRFAGCSAGFKRKPVVLWLIRPADPVDMFVVTQLNSAQLMIAALIRGSIRCIGFPLTHLMVWGHGFRFSHVGCCSSELVLSGCAECLSTRLSRLIQAVGATRYAPLSASAALHPLLSA